jgi:transposase
MLKEDCKIMWDKRMRGFYFLYTRDEPVPDDPDPEGLHKSIGALDGGIRGFQTTCNATTGAYGELACGFKTRIHDRVEKIDDLHSRATRKREGKGVRTQDKRRKTRAQRRNDRVNAKERRRRRGNPPQHRPAKRHHKVTRLNRKLRRERARQTQWVQAVHYDAANFLFKHTDVVINPVLRTSQMAPRAGRVFGKPSTRAMLTMSPYKFNQRLNWKAKRLGTKRVIDDTGEPGTTRTCPNPGCGRWHTHLGRNHIFTCPHCGIVAGRDDVGARGNLLAAYGKAVGILADGTSNGGV